ncbi:MAG: hypothetical protein FRX49_02171 [Trebouxia sp. A1-2]|nr:MAG: hypothetical protein FRX49_02171 [Trebouxia sp. A1-2]
MAAGPDGVSSQSVDNAALSQAARHLGQKIRSNIGARVATFCDNKNLNEITNKYFNETTNALVTQWSVASALTHFY